MQENKVYDALVAGAGIAGLTGAAYLSRCGRSVLVCEKSERIGGLVSCFSHEGFTFDAGIRAFENTGVIYPMLSQLGIHLENVANPVTLGIAGEKIRLSSRESLSDYADMLKRIFPQNVLDIDRISSEIRKVMGYMDVLYGIDNPLFLDKIKSAEYLLKTLLPWLLKYLINIRKASKLNAPVNGFLDSFTKNKALIDMITQHFFQDTPTFFALSYFGLYLDYTYPIGGTGILADKLAEFIRQNGGEIALDSEIIRIDTETRQVHIADGRIFKYRKLLWAGDAGAMYKAIDPQAIRSTRIRSKTAAQKAASDAGSGGDSVLSLYLGIDLDPRFFRESCGAHAFYTPRTEGVSVTGFNHWKSAGKDNGIPGKQALKEIISSYLRQTTYEISCPVLRDPGMAPAGKTGVIVSTLMDYGLVRHIRDEGWYDEFKSLCIEKVTGELDAGLLNGIKGKILFCLCSTPLTIEKQTGNKDGAITGWAFTNKVMPAENRFSKITRSVFTPLPDIFRAGQWTFSPSGLPVSIVTGKIAADTINKLLTAKENK